MNWLSQNWIWLVFGIGILFMMRRGGMGCGMGHVRSGQGESTGGHEHAEPPATTTDPVSNQAVDPATAVTSVYRGRIYRFASRENRDRFEAEPERYAAGTASADSDQKHATHRHGC
jgi:YHS domain-containing protein